MFDGDQMAIFLPITEEAQNEAKEKMLASSGLDAPTGDSDLSIQFNIDMHLGSFYLTQPPSSNKIEATFVTGDYEKMKSLAYSKSEFTIPVKYNNEITSIGRAMSEEILGIPVKEVINKKNNKKIMMWPLRKKYGDKEAVMRAHKYMIQCMEAPALVGKPMSANDYLLSDKIKQLKADGLKSENPAQAIEDATLEYLEEKKAEGSVVYDLIASGARGNDTQIRQSAIAKGYIQDVTGKVTDKAIENSLIDGMTSKEYFEAAAGSRKGIIDRSQNTAVTGYLHRKYVYALAPVKVDRKNKACSTTKFLTFTIDSEDKAKAVLNRYLKGGKLITSIDQVMNKTIELYSPMYCSSTKLCNRCAGEGLFSNVKAENIGIMTGCMLGGNATQLIMKTFHCVHSKMLSYIKYKNKYMVKTFEDIFNMADGEIYINGECEEKKPIDLFVWDLDNWTKVNKVIRHLKHEQSEMVITRSQKNDFIICQDNHPLMVYKNKSNCEKCGSPLIKPKKLGKWVCPRCNESKGVVHHIANDEVEIVEPKNILPNEYFTKSSFPIWQDNIISPMMPGYLIGMHCAEGSLTFRDKTPIYWEMSQTSGEIREKAIKLLENYGKVYQSPDGVHFRINSTKLASEIYSMFGRYSCNIAIPDDFIHYSDKVLSDILCGLIDGDGSVITNRVLYYTTSVKLLQQMHHILNKFDIKHNITICTNKELTNNQCYLISIYPSVKHFDIFSESIKMQQWNWTGSKHITRFDKINYIKPILFNESEYVYDFETESHTHMVNGMYSHNSGGSGSIRSLSEDAPEVKEVCVQDGNDITSLVPLIIEIDEKGVTSETSNEIMASNFKFIIDGKDDIEFLLEYNFTILINDKDAVERESDLIRIHIPANVIFGSMANSSTDLNLTIRSVVKMLETGSGEVKSPEEFIISVWKKYMIDSFIPFLPLEILASQLYRDPDIKAFPYRLGRMNKPPYRCSLKQVPLFENWKRGAAFENVAKSFHYGILNGSEQHQNRSDLEDLLES